MSTGREHRCIKSSVKRVLSVALPLFTISDSLDAPLTRFQLRVYLQFVVFYIHMREPGR
jgi:hypothetical protein